MAEQLHRLLAQTIKNDDIVTLATCGPAGPQVSRVECRVYQSDLYLCLPATSDHLFNLETHKSLVILAEEWELHAQGMHTTSDNFFDVKKWQTVVQIVPMRLHLLYSNGTRKETIDF